MKDSRSREGAEKRLGGSSIFGFAKEQKCAHLVERSMANVLTQRPATSGEPGSASARKYQKPRSHVSSSFDARMSLTLPPEAKPLVGSKNWDRKRSECAGNPRPKSSAHSSDLDWSIGVGQGRGKIDMEDGTSNSGIDKYGGVLYPWLDSLRQKCQSWSTSCVGRVKKVWTPKSSETLSLPLSTKGLRYKWGSGGDLGVGERGSQRLQICPRKSSKTSKRVQTYSAKEDVPAVPRSVRPCRKLIYFIRHGTAFCNVNKYGGWREDQRLTPTGWSQINALRAHLLLIQQPQLVVVSTLSRALETSVGAFGIPVRQKDGSAPGWTEETSQRVLMTPQQAILNLQSSHPGILARAGSSPLLVSEECRERLGDGVIPNKRRCLSEAMTHFPGLDFSMVRTEKDDVYARFDRPGGESAWDICQRGKRFLDFLRNRPEECIAVVSHGHFLHYMLNQQPHSWQEFWNGELRAFQLTESSCLPTRRDLWFKP
ncbi:hypothetical protein BSKO_05599 [Bryopsis sp. KO-2023]|nr:hypothetical protein BSKO_05599 [Bryopsis sp. KO-2023]